MQAPVDIQKTLKDVSDAYEKGASDPEVMKILRITQSKFDDLYSDSSQDGFRRMIDVGRMMSKAFWFELARKNLHDKTFNTALWLFVMKNRFGWAEKSENIEKGDIPRQQLSLDEMRAKLQSIGPDVLKIIFPDKTEAEMLGSAAMLEGPSDRVN